MIPVDLDRLREMGDHWLLDPQLFALRDAVLDAPTVWWCVDHLSVATEFGECQRASMERMAMVTPFPCIKRRAVVVPVKGETE